MTTARTDFDFTPPMLREVSLRVAEVNGINLGQGVSQVPPPVELIERARTAMAEGNNRYAPAAGIPELREATARKLREFNGIDVGPDRVLITGGATGAFESVVQAILNPGDEVILFRPFYPYHRNAVLRSRGVLKFCELEAPGWEFSRDEFLSCFTPKTKMVVITTPNNPTGKLFSREELEWIAEEAAKRDVWCVTDEVYEYLTYDDREHISLGSLPGMADRVITMGSFSKTFSVTGWRIGYLTGPARMMPLLQAVSDQLYVCAPTPFQHAVAETMDNPPKNYYDDLNAGYHRKREVMASALEKAGFEFSRPGGAYYFLVSTRKRFPDQTASQILDRLIDETGIGAVPTSDFTGPEYLEDPKNDHLLRFCYSVPDDVLNEAADRLARFK